LQLVGLRLSLAAEASLAAGIQEATLVFTVALTSTVLLLLLLQLVGPRLSLAAEAASSLRCLLEGSEAAQQQAAAAGATPLLVQVRTAATTKELTVSGCTQDRSMLNSSRGYPSSRKLSAAQCEQQHYFVSGWVLHIC
jgi:hypothetical protein